MRDFAAEAEEQTGADQREELVRIQAELAMNRIAVRDFAVVPAAAAVSAVEAQVGRLGKVVEEEVAVAEGKVW